MLDKLLGRYESGHGPGHMYSQKDHRSSGYNFQEHKQFVTHEESQGGHFDRHMRLPVNHGRHPMPHMPVCEEDDSDSDSDVEEFEKSRHHQQPHHNGKMGNGWQGGHGMQHHGGHKMQHHGEHGMQHHGGHIMQHHGEHGMQHGHGMQHHGEHGHGMQHHGEHGHGMQQHGGHGMQQHGGHGMQQHGGHGMMHHDKLMAPHAPPHHVFMNPGHGSSHGHAVVVKENWRVSNSSSNHHKAGWGSKGL